MLLCPDQVSLKTERPFCVSLVGNEINSRDGWMVTFHSRLKFGSRFMNIKLFFVVFNTEQEKQLDMFHSRSVSSPLKLK